MTSFERHLVGSAVAYGSMLANAALPLTCLSASSPREGRGEETRSNVCDPPLPACGERVRVRGDRYADHMSEVPS